MQDIKPIKRCKQLIPLSREHHDGLLFVWKLRQGLKNNTTVGVLRNFCNWYWTQHIKPHFHQEEKILLQYIARDHKMAVQLKKEHDNIRELVLSIDHNPDTITIAQLADFLYQHIRFEERVLFAHLEKTLSAEQLGIILRQLEEHPLCSTRWEDEFWLNKK